MTWPWKRKREEEVVYDSENEYDGPEPGIVKNGALGLTEAETEVENSTPDDGQQFESEVNTYG